MQEIIRTKNEYGGFLPLELNPGNEYFVEYEDMLCRFNSVKAALNYLIIRLGGGGRRKRDIYIPYYYCPSTIEAIKMTGIKIHFYHMNSAMMPLDLPDESSCMVILVDYFGVCTDKIEQFAYTLQNAEVLFDRAHGFYAKPIIKENVHNIYSAKKFFGIPDGAYLISKTMSKDVQIPTVAHDYIAYLIISYEEGTNAAYEKKKEVDRKLAANYGCMSDVSIGLLKNVDYDRTKKQRTDNYKILYEAFKQYNRLTIPKECAAYQFPLVLADGGEEVKSRLIKDKIFVPTLWSGKTLVENGNEVEIHMMKNAIFLPVDQRYDAADMEYLINRVKAEIRKRGSNEGI